MKKSIAIITVALLWPASALAVTPTSTATPTAVPGAGSVFIGNILGASITVYSQGLTGNIQPYAVISGASTLLSSPQGLAVTPAGKVCVADPGVPAILCYAVGANGNVAPSQNISGGVHTLLSSPFGVAFDSSGNIYVIDAGSGMLEYASNANGDVAPIANITQGVNAECTASTNPWPCCTGNKTGTCVSNLDPYINGGITVDSSGKIYISELGQSSSENAGLTRDVINIYAANSTGNVAPSSTVTGTATLLCNPSGITIDATGITYVANACSSATVSPGADSITVYAANASGNAAPIRQIIGASTTLVTPEYMALDASNNLYETGTGDNYLEFAAGVTGNTAPIATITGSLTQINEAFGIGLQNPTPTATATATVSPTVTTTPSPTATMIASPTPTANTCQIVQTTLPTAAATSVAYFPDPVNEVYIQSGSATVPSEPLLGWSVALDSGPSAFSATATDLRGNTLICIPSTAHVGGSVEYHGICVTTPQYTVGGFDRFTLTINATGANVLALNLGLLEVQNLSGPGVIGPPVAGTFNPATSQNMAVNNINDFIFGTAVGAGDSSWSAGSLTGGFTAVSDVYDGYNTYWAVYKIGAPSGFAQFTIGPNSGLQAWNTQMFAATCGTLRPVSALPHGTTRMWSWGW